MVAINIGEMAELFNFRYRVPSARANWWNYGDNGAYFITICTKYRVHYFGRIINHQMDLSIIGQQAWDCWLQIPGHFPFVELGAFIVMPNHIHGIIIINKKNIEIPDKRDKKGMVTDHHENAAKNQFGAQSQNIPSIVRGLKIGVTKFCKHENLPFGWQPRYHDHIIRNAKEYERISNYILNNPAKWKEDIHNAGNRLL